MTTKTPYALLIYRPDPSTVSGKRAERTLAGHRTLQRQASSHDDLRAVARLDVTNTAKRVRTVAGSHDVTDGPYVETKEWLVGFYLVDCESEDEAVSRAKTICDEDHVIEVRPASWIWRQA